MPNSRNKDFNKDFNAETRQTILQVSRRLFLELGFRAVSTRRIAEACGLTQPALYHHFANKQDLYLAVHREMLTERRQGLDRIAHRGEGLTDSLSTVIRYLLAAQSDDINLLFHDLAHELDAEVRDSIRDLFRENVVAPIVSIFAQAIEQGTLQAVHDGGVTPETATYLLLSLIQGTGHISDRPEDTVYSIDKAADLIADILLSGLPRPRPK